MNDNRTVSADGWEHCVALGSVGFSRGVHYWEFTIDKYSADTDPAFGIARIDVGRDKMLGESPPLFLFSYFFIFFPIKKRFTFDDCYRGRYRTGLDHKSQPFRDQPY